MAKRPTYKELEGKVKELESERDFFREAIEAVSHPFYAIDVNSHEVLMANPASASLHGDLTGKPLCYAWTHKRSAPCTGDEHPCPIKIIQKTKKPVTVEHTHYDKQGRPQFYEIHAYPLFDDDGNLTKIIEYSLEISRLKKMEEVQKESEERYRTLMQNIPVGLYRNTPGPKGMFVMANPTILEMFGYDTVEEFLMTPVSDLYWDPTGREVFSDKLLSKGKLTAEEVQLKKRDGTFIWGSVTASAVCDESGEIKYFDGMIEDITERKQAEEALRESENRYRSLLEASPDPIVV